MATPTVLILFFLLLALVFLLILSYKKLNQEANGEYTVRRIVFKEGGLRDQFRSAVLAVETRLGVHLWPQSDLEEHSEEMQDMEAEIGECDSQESESEEDNRRSVTEEDKMEGCTGKKEDTDSDDELSLESLVIKSQNEERGEDNVIVLIEDRDNVDMIRGAGFQKHLQFSGSAIWSDEGKGEDNDVTVL